MNDENNNPDFNSVPETRDFTSDFAPQMPADTNAPSSPKSYDFTSDYAPDPPTDTPDE